PLDTCVDSVVDTPNLCGAALCRMRRLWVAERKSQAGKELGMNPRPNVRSLSLLISLPALAAGSAFADLLTVHGGSLTQYRAGATGVQDVRPLAMQRGVNLDGTLREPAVQPWVLQ